MLKTAAVVAALVAVLVYLHEVGRTEDWKTVRAIDQSFIELAATIAARLEHTAR